MCVFSPLPCDSFTATAAVVVVIWYFICLVATALEAVRTITALGYRMIQPETDEGANICAHAPLLLISIACVSFLIPVVAAAVATAAAVGVPLLSFLFRFFFVSLQPVVPSCISTANVVLGAEVVLSRSNLGMANLRTFRVEQSGGISRGLAYFEAEVLTTGHVRVGWCTTSMRLQSTVRRVCACGEMAVERWVE